VVATASIPWTGTIGVTANAAAITTQTWRISPGVKLTRIRYPEKPNEVRVLRFAGNVQPFTEHFWPTFLALVRFGASFFPAAVLRAVMRFAAAVFFAAVAIVGLLPVERRHARRGARRG
jgi:hypothetical protein